MIITIKANPKLPIIIINAIIEIITTKNGTNSRLNIIPIITTLTTQLNKILINLAKFLLINPVFLSDSNL